MIDQRPLPFFEEGSAEYWQSCRDHVLRMQACARCKKMRFPPRPMCPSCRSLETEMTEVSGKGTIYSYIVVHRPVMPYFNDRLPFPVALIELDEDPSLRLVGGLVGDPCEPELSIGARVEVAFEDVEDVTLPVWKIAP